MSKYLIWLCLIPIARFFVNLNGWLLLNKALKKQNDFVMGLGEGVNDTDRMVSNLGSDWITSNLTEIKRRVENAGVQNPRKSFMENAGFNHAVQQHYTNLDNLLMNNVDVFHQGRHILEIAKGYYLTNMKQSLNPLHWLEAIFFLPQTLVSASGFKGSSKSFEIALKIVQLLYWLTLIGLVALKPELLETFLKAKK